MNASRQRTPDEESVQLESVELFEVLGRGGTATVRRGYQPLLDRHVAVKIFNEGAQSFSADAVANELRVAAVLPPHPAIVAVYSGGATDGAVYLISELVSGGSLAQRLASAPAMSLCEVVSMSIWLASALETIHLHGVVHGDLSASNVLCTRSGMPKLADFGLASASVGVPRRGLTPGAVAPELLAGDLPSTASDLFQLGVIMRQAAASAGSHELDNLIDRLTAHRATDRPSSAGEVLEELRELEQALPEASLTPCLVIPPEFDEIAIAGDSSSYPTEPPHSPTHRARSPRLMILGALVLLLCGVLVGRWLGVTDGVPGSGGTSSSPSTADPSVAGRAHEPIQRGLATYTLLSAVADPAVGAPTGQADQRDASGLTTEIVQSLGGSNLDLMPSDTEMTLPRLPYRIELQAYNALESAPCRVLLTGEIGLTGSGERLAMVDTEDGAVMVVVWVASLASSDDAHALLSTYAFHAGLGVEGCAAASGPVRPAQVTIVHGRKSEPPLDGVDEFALWRGDAAGTASAVGLRRGRRVAAVLLRGPSGPIADATLGAIARAAAASLETAP